jgi:hypothetical protein
MPPQNLEGSTIIEGDYERKDLKNVLANGVRNPERYEGNCN